MIKGIFLSMIYFIVIPIIPEKKHPSMVMVKRIPVLVFSLVFKMLARKIPRESPARQPVKVSKTMSGKLFP